MEKNFNEFWGKTGLHRCFVLLPNQFLLSSHPQLRKQINKVFKFAFEKNNLAFEEINRQREIHLRARKEARREKKDGSSRAFSATLPGRKLIGPNRGWLFHHPVHGIMADSHVSRPANGNASRSTRGTGPADVPRSFFLPPLPSFALIPPDRTR